MTIDGMRKGNLTKSSMKEEKDQLYRRIQMMGHTWDNEEEDNLVFNDGV